MVGDCLRVLLEDCLNDSAEALTGFTGKTEALDDCRRSFALCFGVECVKPDTENLDTCLVGNLLVADKADEFCKLVCVACNF